MSSVAAPEIVEPAYLWVPEYHSTAGGEVADLAESAGMPLDAEQRMALDVIFAEHKNGSKVCREFCIICARQNLKTYVLQAATLGDAFLFDDDEPLLIWTAHLFDTAQEAFRDLDAIIEGSEHLSRRVLKVSRANGDEGFELKSGARIKFKARSNTSGRGLSGKVVTLDEAFALSATVMGALQPTLSAKQDSQTRYGSSAGLASSAILRGVRDRGRKGGDPTLGYIEYCAPEGSCQSQDCSHELDTAGCALDDPEQIRKANPALYRRIPLINIQTERRVLSTEPEEFARERLGWWSAPDSADRPYPVKDWKGLVDTTSTRVDVPAFAIDINPVRTRSAIAYCASRADELQHLEVSDYRAGTDWVLKRATKIHEKFPSAKFGIAADGQAATLIPDLEKAGIEVAEFKSRELAQACGVLADAIRDRTCRHIDQQELNDAVEMARKRETEGGWTLARKGGDIAPLVAIVLAHQLYLGGSATSIYEERGLVEL